MHVLLIVVGLLLLLFGGGCTLLFLGFGLTDPGSIGSDMPLFLSIWLPLGLLPLVAGYFMFRTGLRKDRERRAAQARPPGEGPPA